MKHRQRIDAPSHAGRAGPAQASVPGRVLYHHRTQCRGAEGVHVRGIAKAFRQAGSEVEVLGPPGVCSDADAGRAQAGGQKGLGGGVLRWFSAKAPEVVFELGEILYNVYAVFALLGRLCRRRCDLIYERYALFLAAGVAAARVCRVPIVVEVNDSVTIERSRPLALRYLATRMERWILRNATLVVTVSQPFKRRLLGHGLSEERVLVTHNAVDPGDWPDEPDTGAAGADAGPVTIGCVAAFVAWHRPELLIDCVAEVMSSRDVRLLMVGDGPARPAAERRARDLGCASRVEFTGFVPHEKVRELLSTVDIAVIPHSNDHGSPMKIFEYMAAGKAIVAPACGPIMEIVEDGETGLLFGPSDHGGLTQVLVRLAEDSALRRRLGRDARQRVLRRHTWSRNVRRVLERLGVIDG